MSEKKPQKPTTFLEQPRVEPLVPLGALLQSILVMPRGKAKAPILSKGICSHKTGPVLGWKGSSKMQVHPPVAEESFPVYGPALPPSPPSSHPLPSAEERGKFFLFWVWKEPGWDWRGEAAPGDSPGAADPRYPTVAWKKAGNHPGKGWRSPKSKRWQSGSYSIAQPWQFGAVSVPGTPVPQFPHRS